MDVALFVPGFFGFGAFGHPDRPLIEYFARIENALLRAHVRPLHFVIPHVPELRPRWMIRPRSTTRIWLARRTLLIRWAMMKVVRPTISRSSACWI